LILKAYSKAHGQNIDGSDTLSGESYQDHPPGQMTRIKSKSGKIAVKYDRIKKMELA
jgi:hypothetical protein